MRASEASWGGGAAVLYEQSGVLEARVRVAGGTFGAPESLGPDGPSGPRLAGRRRRF